MLVIGSIVHLADAGTIMHLVVIENIVHLVFAVMLTMIIAGVKEDIKQYT